MNFHAYTFPPAESRGNTLESLEAAIEYYHKRGVEEVCLQAKSMGNNLTVYLHKDGPQASYATTRNGYGLRKGLAVALLTKIHPRYDYLFARYNAKMLVISGEYVPWSALGRGLIDKEYRAVEKGLNRELANLKRWGFPHEENIPEQSIEDRLEAGQRFLEQIDIYDPPQFMTCGGDANMLAKITEFHAFTLLKVIGNDDVELVACKEQTPIFTYNELNEWQTEDQSHLPDETRNIALFQWPKTCVTIKTTDMEAIQAMYTQLVGETPMREGAVIKPCVTQAEILEKKLIPCMKVRNPEFLRLIYGYTYMFPSKLEHLCKNKKTWRKNSQSVKEFKIAHQMLELPIGSCQTGNKEWERLVKKIQKFSEVPLDPRH